jgi:hypothetical protein
MNDRWWLFQTGNFLPHALKNDLPAECSPFALSRACHVIPYQEAQTSFSSWQLSDMPESILIKAKCSPRDVL